jgi:hypothetical protein
MAARRFDIDRGRYGLTGFPVSEEMSGNCGQRGSDTQPFQDQQIGISRLRSNDQLGCRIAGKKTLKGEHR